MHRSIVILQIVVAIRTLSIARACKLKAEEREREREMDLKRSKRAFDGESCEGAGVDVERRRFAIIYIGSHRSQLSPGI